MQFTAPPDLKSRVRDLAAAKVEMLFRQAEATRLSPPDEIFADPAAPIGVGRLAEILRNPMLGRELHEGKLIETCVALALESTGRAVKQNKKFAVTEPDLALVAENDFSKLSSIRPPAPGRFVRGFEVDIVCHHPQTKRFECVDIKRTALDATLERDHRTLFEAASVAALRFIRRGDLEIVETRLATVRWYASDQAASGGILSRETVDAALEAPVRETVDFALAVYKAEFDRLLAALVRRITTPPIGVQPLRKKAKRSSALGDPTPAPLSLDDAWKMAVRAGRPS